MDLRFARFVPDDANTLLNTMAAPYLLKMARHPYAGNRFEFLIVEASILGRVRTP
jgi:hypothetical protein